VGNTFGERLRVTTFGESHGPAVGCVVDGCPAGLTLGSRHIATALARDVPMPAVGTTRREPNRPRILSGVFRGRTLGTPIAIVVANEDVESQEYEGRRHTPRPGHAELTYLARYGEIDWRGGGRASGRECVARVAAGAIARRLLATKRAHVRARVETMAGISTDSPEGLSRAVERVRELASAGETTGGMVRLRARGLPAGLGGPVFDKLTARLGHALLGIGGVKAIDIGNGRAAAALTGSLNNDAIEIRDGEVLPASNRAGGVQGGLTTGLPLDIRIWVKPTPSVARGQRSVNLETGEPVELHVQGRFDLNITPRVAVVAEAMACLVLADALLEGGHLHPTRLRPARDAVDAS
jgi:chorismate synthase